MNDTAHESAQKIHDAFLERSRDHEQAWKEFCEGFQLPSVVYFVGAPNGLVKIGFAADLDIRFGELLSASPVPLRILAFVEGGRGLEGEYHRQFAAHRLHGEWFERCPEIEAEIERLSTPSTHSRKDMR